jgi:hypothetical protein
MPCELIRYLSGYRCLFEVVAEGMPEGIGESYGIASVMSHKRLVL